MMIPRDVLDELLADSHVCHESRGAKYEATWWEIDGERLVKHGRLPGNVIEDIRSIDIEPLSKDFVKKISTMIGSATITSKKTGKAFKANDWNDLSELAIEIMNECKDACLVYCDLETFALDMKGKWLMMDECNHWEYIDEDKFTIDVNQYQETKKDDPGLVMKKDEFDGSNLPGNHGLQDEGRFKGIYSDVQVGMIKGTADQLDFEAMNRLRNVKETKMLDKDVDTIYAAAEMFSVTIDELNESNQGPATKVQQDALSKLWTLVRKFKPLKKIDGTAIKGTDKK
jgi:hypothetical protein